MDTRTYFSSCLCVTSFFAVPPVGLHPGFPTVAKGIFQFVGPGPFVAGCLHKCRAVFTEKKEEETGCMDLCERFKGSIH